MLPSERQLFRIFAHYVASCQNRRLVVWIPLEPAASKEPGEPFLSAIGVANLTASFCFTHRTLPKTPRYPFCSGLLPFR